MAAGTQASHENPHSTILFHAPQPTLFVGACRPQTMGSVFKDRIDLSYVADNGRAGEYERHRAIKILRPTTEMSGLYKCKVSSFVDEDFLTARMTVFGECNMQSE